MSKILEIFNTMEYGPAPEAPDAVKAWLDQFRYITGHYAAKHHMPMG